MSRSVSLYLSRMLRFFLKKWLEIRARVLRQGFVCNALQGESEYNISINCDMTVSCNCQDDGSGILGSLEDNSFEEIFFGPKANGFRESVAKGTLPILTCARCSELRRNVRATGFKRSDDLDEDVEASCTQDSLNGEVQKHDFNDLNEQHDSTISTPRLPYRGILVENTVACNLACPGCIRPQVMKVRKKSRLSLDDLRKISGLIQRLGLKKTFYFNRGEPFLSPDILQEMKIIRELNPDVYIVTSTNGMCLDSDDKREAALLMDEIEFSIDGCDQKSLQKYQRGGNFERALNNLRDLARFRDARGLGKPQIEWKYLLFNWNDRPKQIAQAISLAKGDLPSHKKHKKTQAVSTTYNKEITGAAADVISFWPTNNPFYGISWRYRLGLLNHIGNKSWKGREIRLRPESADPVESA